jgi:hypothetical protein
MFSTCRRKHSETRFGCASQPARLGLNTICFGSGAKRFGLFGTPGQPKRELSVPEVCALRVAALVLHKCHGITVREALDVSARLAVPAFEAMLTGERGTETLEIANDKTGEQVLISLGGVIADVLPRLGLGFVSQGFGRAERVTPNQIGVLQ